MPDTITWYGSMMKKHLYTIGLILLLIIPALLLNSGCADGTSTVPLGEALQGRYTIEGEDGIVAYLDLSDGKYTVLPKENLDKSLLEMNIHFFSTNPAGTYTITRYGDGITENTTPEDLDKNKETDLLSIEFDSPTNNQWPFLNFWALVYDGPREIIYLEYRASTIILHEISKPWE